MYRLPIARSDCQAGIRNCHVLNIIDLEILIFKASVRRCNPVRTCFRVQFPSAEMEPLQNHRHTGGSEVFGHISSILLQGTLPLSQTVRSQNPPENKNHCVRFCDNEPSKLFSCQNTTKAPRDLTFPVLVSSPPTWGGHLK